MTHQTISRRSAGSAELQRMQENAAKTGDFLKSLANPTRLLILCRLKEGKATVGDLEKFLEIPQAAVSKQLARLREDDLVAATRHGRSITYELADERADRLVDTLYSLFCKPSEPRAGED